MVFILIFIVKKIMCANYVIFAWDSTYPQAEINHII